MENCIFCKIVKGDLPSHKIYEDDDFLAFLDIRPLSPGHALVIPKKIYRFVWYIPNAGYFFGVAKKIALAQKKAFGAEIILSKIIGEEVPHAHIWIYPDEKTKGQKKDFAQNAERIRKSLNL